MEPDVVTQHEEYPAKKGEVVTNQGRIYEPQAFVHSTVQWEN